MSRWRDLPSLSLLRAFDATARHGGFTGAGRVLNVTHAAVTQAVRGLEAELGVVLVRREGRTVRLTGQTELLIKNGAKYTSIIALIRAYERKSPYHLRGAFDHLVLAAAGIANQGHAHKLIDPDGKVVDIEHSAWSVDEARAYLTMLVTELLDTPHGYLLPFDGLSRALFGQRVVVRPSVTCGTCEGSA